MQINFQVKSLPSVEFEDYFKLSASELQALGATLVKAHAKPGYPCRVSLEEAEVGEQVLLINYPHHQTTGAYAASGPIFIRKGVKSARLEINQLPSILSYRPLSIRAYHDDGHMVASEVASGSQLRPTIARLLEDAEVTYLQIHNAGPGCFNCQIDRIAS